VSGSGRPSCIGAEGTPDRGPGPGLARAWRPAKAEECFQQALAIAREQGARSLELGAAVNLARLWHQHGKTAAARQALAEICDWFTEGFETPTSKRRAPSWENSHRGDNREHLAGLAVRRSGTLGAGGARARSASHSLIGTPQAFPATSGAASRVSWVLRPPM
jgi:hypothetical protein